MGNSTSFTLVVVPVRGDETNFYSIISALVYKGLEDGDESFLILDAVISAMEPMHRYNDVVGHLELKYELALRVYTFHRYLNADQNQILADFFAQGFVDDMVHALDVVGDEGYLDPHTDGLINFEEGEEDKQCTWSFPYFYAAVA